MKVSTTTGAGLLFGVILGVLGMGRISGLGSDAGQLVQLIHGYGWWIVVLSMLVPLADYLSGVRTTVTGVMTGHPFRKTAGFFAGLAVGLGLFLLLAPKLL